MQQFTGEYEHTLDSKGRVILPAKCRESFSSGIYISKAPEYSLQVWSTVEFHKHLETIQEWQTGDKKRRRYVRAFTSGAYQDTPDSQGRITVPPKLRTYAKLDRELMIIGVGTKLEIWDRASWTEFIAGADEDFADQDVPW